MAREINFNNEDESILTPSRIIIFTFLTLLILLIGIIFLIYSFSLFILCK